MSTGLRKVSDCFWKVSDGLGKLGWCQMAGESVISLEEVSDGLRGMSAEQVSLPWIMMEGKGRLCCSTKVVEYIPDVCLIEGCLDYL